jgi:hypothetical protein
MFRLVLLGLLTGIRASRAPLIVGYVVLAGAWLLLYDELPEKKDLFEKRYPEIGGIFAIVGPLGKVAAASFLAYLVGDLVVRESSRALQIRGAPPVEAAKGRVRQGLRWLGSITHDTEMDELEERLKECVARALGEDLSPAERRARERQLLERIGTTPGTDLRGLFPLSRKRSSPARLELQEQVRVEAKSGRIDERILATNPELFNELFRLRSEAEFRAGLLPSLALLRRRGRVSHVMVGAAAGRRLGGLRRVRVPAVPGGFPTAHASPWHRAARGRRRPRVDAYSRCDRAGGRPAREWILRAVERSRA